MRRSEPISLAALDPGWLFLAAGLALFVATILIPAEDDARTAERQLDQVRMLANHQNARVARYSEYLDALDRNDPALIASLAAMHLHLAPAGKRVIRLDDPERFARAPIDVFTGVEPLPPESVPAYKPVNSILGRLARGERARLILLASAAMSLLIGLLPPASIRTGRQPGRVAKP